MPDRDSLPRQNEPEPIVDVEDDEDEFAFAGEYGLHSVSEPCAAGEGSEYWVIRCYPEAVRGAL